MAVGNGGRAAAEGSYVMWMCIAASGQSSAGIKAGEEAYIRV